MYFKLNQGVRKPTKSLEMLHLTPSVLQISVICHSLYLRELIILIILFCLDVNWFHTKTLRHLCGYFGLDYHARLIMFLFESL